MAKFNERLRYLRENKKLTQKDIANKFKLGESTISMYERGEREPSFEFVEQIADFFDVSTDYLLGRTDTPSQEEVHIPEGTILSEIDPDLAKKFIQAMNDPLEELFFDDILSASKEEREELIREFLKMRKEMKKKDY